MSVTTGPSAAPEREGHMLHVQERVGHINKEHDRFAQCDGSRFVLHDQAVCDHYISKLMRLILAVHVHMHYIIL